jgi:hypothetical protein
MSKGKLSERAQAKHKKAHGSLISRMAQEKAKKPFNCIKCGKPVSGNICVPCFEESIRDSIKKERIKRQVSFSNFIGTIERRFTEYEALMKLDCEQLIKEYGRGWLLSELRSEWRSGEILSAEDYRTLERILDLDSGYFKKTEIRKEITKQLPKRNKLVKW